MLCNLLSPRLRGTVTESGQPAFQGKGFQICKMTIAMADKLVTSFKFTKENKKKKKEGLNSVFADFINI